MAPEFEFKRVSPPPEPNLHDHQGGSMNNCTIKDAVEYLRKVKKTFEKTPDLFAKFLEIMKDFKNSKIPVQEVKDKVANLFHGHDDVLLGFNMFLPEEHKIVIPVHQLVQTPIQLQAQLQEAVIFVNLIKTRFTDEPRVFNSFLRVLDLYKTNHKSCQEIYQEVEPLFKDHSDLLSGFMRFLPIKNNFACWQAGSFRREDWSSDIIFQIPQHVNVGNLLEQNGSGRASMDSEVSDHSEGDERKSHPNSKKHMWENGSQSMPHHSSDEDKESLSGAQSLKGVDDVTEEEKREKKRKRSERRIRTPPLLAKEKYDLCKSVSELDLSNCKQCTPSYRLLPEDYPVPPSSYRTELEKSLLNDACVLVTSVSEDYASKHMQKNQYEEILFLCEDDRFELDMLMESAKLAKKRIKKLMKKRSKKLMKKMNEDYLTPMNLRCIEKLYGDHGLDALEVLRREPEAALPVLLSRLKQKLKEWNKCSNDFNKVWSDVFAKNYHKSLDHRSFNFKQ